MESKWPCVIIKNLCEITSSKRIYAEEYLDNGVPFYRGKEIIEKQRGQTQVSTELFISEEKYHEIERKFGIPEPGDLLLTSVGTLGVPYIVKQGERFYFKDGNLTWFRKFNGLDSRYLYYWLLSQSGKAQLLKCTIGSSQSAFTIVLLKEIEIELPPLPVQRRIAAILSAYDDLIENNNRRIQILEEMAQAIYREWFVHFRFPGHENVRMVKSELGEIPEGWEVKTLAYILSTIEAGSRPKGGINSSETEVPSIGAENIIGLGKYDFSKDKFVSQEFFNKMNRGHVLNNDVLLYKDGAHIGRKSLFRNGFPHKICCVNEHVFILRTNERCNQEYLYFWLDTPEMTQNIKNLNSNAAQPGINQDKVINLPILLPSRVLLNRFQEFVYPLLGLLFTLAKKNRILVQSRDLLLPRLVSGELDVSSLDT